MATGPSSVQGEAPGSLSVMESDLTMDGTDNPSPASDRSGVVMVTRKPARELVYSKNPKSSVWAMCPLNHSRLWVRYSPAGISPCHMKLFDAEGQILTMVQEKPKKCSGLISATGDVMLAWNWGDRNVQLITPNGRTGTYDIGATIGHLVSSATNREKNIFSLNFTDSLAYLN